MSNLLQRTITGFLFGIVVIGAMVLGKYTFALLLIIICGLGLNEFYKLSLSKTNRKFATLALAYGVAIVTFYITSDLFLNKSLDGIRDYFLLFMVILCFILFSILDIFWNAKPQTGQVLLGFILIPLSIITLWQYGYHPELNNCLGYRKDITQYNYSFELPLALLILTWANDVGAYFSGKFLGKRKLFERISPNKTWAGFYGGVILTITTLFFLNESHLTGFGSFNIYSILILGLTISAFATFGDLYQSYTKRIYGVKDSGKLLPGHGGIWDRFDGFFFVIYGYLFFQFIFLYIN